MPVCFRLVCGFIVLSGDHAGGRYRSAAQSRELVVRSDARTGRLVRSVAVAPRAVPERVIEARVVPAQTSNGQRDASAWNLSDAVEQVAQQHALPPLLIHSVIKAESNYNPYAVSPKGALGLMQLVPGTARRFGVKDVFDPLDNLQGGARYLKHLLGLYGSYPLALAAYNAGEGAVDRYRGIPPYRETVEYVARVRKNWEKIQRTTEREPAPVRPASVYNAIRRVTDASGAVYYVRNNALCVPVGLPSGW